MTKSVMRQFLCLVSMLFLCIGNVFSQNVVNLGTDLYSTKYYESMNAANPPSGDWYATDYDDSGWEDYTNPLDFPEYDAFWVRRTFFVTDDPANHPFQLQYAHDNEGSFYLNGNLLHSCSGVCGRYCYVNVPSSYFVNGLNVLAAYTKDDGGDQYLDCSLLATDGSDIIVEYPSEPVFSLSSSNICLYDVENYSENTIIAKMITPTGVVGTEVSWASSNPDVADVTDGLVTALSAGKTVVTATTTYNGVTYSKNCSVEVREIALESKVVFVDVPGTLDSLLTDDEKDNVDNLVVFGKLNGRDVQVLRYMTGRNERGNRTPGTLADLDLYNVEFVSGSNNSFRVNRDRTEYVYAGSLPSCMFYDCVALNSIVLPESITKICGEAFRGCTNLETIVLPSNLSIIEGSVFLSCTNLKSFTLPSSVTSIGGSLFDNCQKLENFSFADGTRIREIPNNCFGQTGLKSITIPASVTSIGELAFYNSKITSVLFQEGSKLVEIRNRAFDECHYLSSISVPEGCLEFGNQCFGNCYPLSSITIPVSLASIGEIAFLNCNNLTDFIIPENSKLISIGANAFEGTSISSFYIPKGLISITDVFSNSNQLQALTVHPENKYYESVDGIVYSKRDKAAVLVPKSIDGFMSFPDYVTNIPDNLLQNCTKLKGVVFHSGITRFGQEIFSGCSGLQTLMTLSSTPTSVSAKTFNGINKSFVTLVVPQGSLEAYREADVWKDFENIQEASDQPILLLSANNVIVYDVTDLSARTSTVLATVITRNGIITDSVTWVSSNESVAIVDDGVVEYTGEGTATITASITVGGYSASASCSVTSVGMTDGKLVYVDAGNLSTLLTQEEKDELTHLIVMGRLNNDDIRVLRYMAGRDEYGNLTVGSLEVLDMGGAKIVSGGENGYYYRDNWWRGVSDNYFGSDIFRQCNSLKKVVLPSSLNSIEANAFNGCQNLEEVVLPDGLTYIGSEMFRDCRKLSKVNIPSSVTTLNGGTFAGCTNLKSIDLSTMTGVNTIPDNMFYGSGLNSINIPANVTSIGYRAFSDTPLKTVLFDNDSRLSTIGDEAFQSTQLQSITIPASVTSINNYAFNNCRKLSSITYADNCRLTSVGENSFNDCPISTFVIPKNLIYMGYQSFSDSLKQIVVEEGNKFFESVDGMLCSKSDNSLVYVPKNKTSVYLPSYITVIKNGVLRYHHELRTVVLTSGISDLGESPFYDNYNLTEIYCMNPVPPTVSNLTYGWNGENKKIYIPVGSKEDYEDVRWESYLLEERSYSKSVVLSESSLTLYNAIGGNSATLSGKVFSENGPVQYSTVTWTSSSNSVATVDSLGHVRYIGPGTATIVASTTLDGNEYTAECIVTSVAVDDPDNAYYLTGQGNDLRSLIGEDNKYNKEKLVLIGKISNDDCNFIKEMSAYHSVNGQEVPGSLKYLDMSELSDTILADYFLDGCYSISSIVLPENTVKIGGRAFGNCNNLVSIQIPASVKTIEWEAFSNCPNLKTIRLFGMEAPNLNGTSFNGTPLGSLCVIVPTGSVGYQTKDYWKDISNIYETSMLPIIVLDYNNVELYNISVEGANAQQLEALAITTEGVKTTGINWSSSDNNVATVSADGLVTAGNTEGEAIITASYTDNGKTGTIECLVNLVDVTGFKFVNVKTAGTLSELITEDEKDELQKLIVSGNINSDDIRTLRYMAGRDEYGNPTVGSLEILNISRARIVQGGDGYYNRDNWWRTVDYDHFGDDIFRECNSLKKVVLPSSLRTIGSYAFYGCQSLEEVVLPEGLTNIYYEAFGDCRKLATINIPSSVTNLSGWIFYGCKALKSIDLSTMTGVNGISEHMFYQSGLTNVIIPANITNIANGAFQETPLKTVQFESGSKLTMIDEYAFYMTQLQSVTIPASVVRINNQAFNGCQKMTEVNYEDNNKLNYFGEGVFNGCPIKTFVIPRRLISMGYQSFSDSLKQIVVEEGNRYFEVIDGVLYCTSDNSLVYAPRDNESIYLPSYITSIKNGALREHYNLKIVVLSSTITDLGDSPFWGDNNLTEVYCMNSVPPRVVNLTDNWYCERKIFIPRNSKGDYVDANWESNLLVESSYSKSVALSESSLTLYGAIGGNSSLLTGKVFSENGPVQYSTITWASSNNNVVTVDSLGQVRYAGPGSAKITATTTLEGDEYTAECNVTSIAVNDSEYAYYLTGQGNLRTLIGEDNKYNIERLVLVGKLSEDDRNFIREMSCNRSVGGQEVMGALKYLDMSQLVDTIIGGFSDCRSLEVVKLPDNLKILDDNAFAYCTNLASLTIPENVREMRWGALRACNSLNSIVLLGNEAPQLSDYTFGEITSKYCVIIPVDATGYRTKDFWKDMTNVYSVDMLPILVMDDRKVELYNISEESLNTHQLTAHVITVDGIKTDITWQSSNDSIASVSGDGLITAGNIEGQTTVTASYTSSGKTVSVNCPVSVVDVTGFKCVNVVTAGTLSDLLSEDEFLDTKKLIVIGELNSDDIRTLRYMAGRDENGNMTVGSLEILNMYNAKIVSGGEGYYYRDGYWRRTETDRFGEYIFRECNSLKKIVLPQSLNTIVSYAFQGCQNIEEVVMPDGLVTIEYNVFHDCRKLTTVNIPSSVKNLYDGVFQGCTSLKSIDLSSMTGVNAISGGMFRESGLTSIRIPANITNIGSYAFYNTQLKTVEFESGSKLTTISDGAFQSTQLQSVTIPASVASINNDAFNDCRKLIEVNYEENSKLSSMGDNVFNGCPLTTFIIPKRLISMGRQDFSETLTQIIVDEENKFFESVDGVLCSKAEGSLVFVPKRKKSVYLPEYVTILKDGVLRYHYDLQMLVLSANMTDLGESPFYQCNNLKEIYCLNTVPPTARNLTNDFPQSTVFISEGCRNAYLEAGWDDSRINLVEHSFSNSLSLTTSEQMLYNVEGGNNIKLEAKVFSTSGPVPFALIDWVSSDTTVVRVSSDGMLSFAGQGLATVTASIILDGTMWSDSCVVNAKMLDNAENTTFVFVETAGNLPNQISAADKKVITNLVVFGNINATDINFIREMARIPHASWYETPEGSLEYLDLSGATIVEGGGEYGYADWMDENGGGHGDWLYTSANTIGKAMFWSSPILKTIILPNNITKIGQYAFRDCNKLENVVLPKSLSFIDNDAFNNCPLLSSFTIPESIDSLGWNALNGFDEIYANSTTPIKILSTKLISDDAIVIVPADALQTYRSAVNWKQFAGQIMPDNLNIQTVVTLNVTAEDESSGLLIAAGGDDALAFIKDLTLKGTINGYDIAMIRNRMPRLHYLDLSDVTIVANPYEYYTDSHTERNRLGRNAFRELSKLVTVVLPKTIDYIGDNAFYRCNNLSYVKMFQGLTTIDNYTFAECHNLTEVELPEGLLSIGYGAFRSCDNLEEIEIPSTVLAIGGSAFADCYSLQSMVLPKNMTKIENETFWYCRNLESVVLPAKVNRIESNAFYGCSKLNELRLPPMIEIIGDRAFYECNNIKDVYVYIANSKDIKIDMNTFSCWTSATLHIPSFSYNSYFWDTQWGQFYSKVEFSEVYDEFYTKNTLALNDETGTIQGDPDAVLYEKGGLVVDEIEQVLDAVELKSDGTDGASLIASESGTITVSKLTINIDVEAFKWHFFCFPFDIPLDSIHYDGEHVWRQYDGQARSRREGGWQDLASGTTTLSKGRGYIFQGTVTGSLTFTIDNPDLSAKDESTGLFTHESESPQDANWNFIGNPYTSYYNIDEATYSAPITVWTGSGYEAYRPGDDDYQFAPYQAFFVQTPENTDSISFDANGRESYEDVQAMMVRRRNAPRRTQIDPNRLFVNLEVSEVDEDKRIDKTRIVFNNNQSMDYELSCDAAKFFSESCPIELYSLDVSGVMYSINERPVGNGKVDLGIKVNEAGFYYINAVRMDTPVLLIDNELNITHDLSEGGYSFSADKGESTRFTLKLSGSTTGIIESMSDAEQDDMIYDLQGRKLNESDAKGIIIRNGKKEVSNY